MEIKSRQLLPKSYRSPIWAAVFGATISILGFFMAQGWKDDFAESSFNDAAKQYANVIQNQISSHIKQIYDIGNLYEASDVVRRRDFKQFASRGLTDNTATINIQWLPHVPYHLYKNFEMETRHFEFPDFKIREIDSQGNLIEVEKRPSYFPIYYTESFADDFNNIIGLDPTTEFVRERVGLQEYDQRQNLITQTYKKNHSLPNGLVETYLPVYRSLSSDSNEKKLLGIIRATFDIKILLANTAHTVGSRADNINALLFDQASDANSFAMHTSERDKDKSYGKLTQDRHAFYLIDFANRKWSLILTPRNMSYFSKRGEYIPYVILFIGITITLLLTLYLLFIIRRQSLEFKANKEENITIQLDTSDIEKPDNEEGMWAIDKSGITTFANSYMIDILGYSGLEDLTDRYIYSLMSRDSKRKCIDAIKKQKMGIHEEFEISLRSKSNSLIPVRINLTPFFDDHGRYDGALANISRISKSDNDASLDINQEKLHAITAFASDITSIVDVNANFQYVSSSLEKACDFSSSEMLGKSAYDFIHPDDVQDLITATKGISKKTGAQISLPEFRFKKKDGSYLYFEGTATNMLNVQGVHGIVNNAKDVTEKHHQKILAKAQAKALEAITEDASLKDIFSIITEAVESIIPTAHAAIFTYDSKEDSVSLSTAPNLDQSFCRSMQSLKVSDHYGCTTTAIYENKINITADILIHPHHLSWREKLSKANLRAAWSCPVTSVKNEKLGAITCYFDAVQAATDLDKDILSAAANSVSHVMERIHAENALRDSEIKWRSLIAHMPDYVALLDLEGRIIFANRVGHGFSIEQVIGTNLLDYIDKDHREGFRETMDKVLESDKPQTFILPLPTPRGTLWWSNRIGLMKKGGETIGFVTIGSDITETKQNEQSLLKLSSAVDQSASAVVITSIDGDVEYVNKRYTEITGYDYDEVLGNKSHLFTSKSNTTNAHQLSEAIKSGKSWHGEIESTRKNGEKYWELVSISPIHDDTGDLTHFVTVSEDLTELKNTQFEIERLSYYDTLTGLENRRLFRERLEHHIEKCIKEDKKIAVLYLDLDQFKRINDTLGHDAGDSLLKSAAKLLRDVVSADDFVARLGGDEFAILLTDIPNSSAAGSMARKILQEFEKPIKIQDQEIITTTSIGITVAPADTTDPTTMIKNADLAMYRAKELGRNNYQFFTSEMNIEALGRLFLENELRQAIEKQQFEIHYQPIINMNTQTIAGFESLVRWNHPSKGLISPEQFIYIAEETGLIVPLGEIIIKEACKEINKIHESGTAKPKVAVNLSVRQFQDPNLPEIIKTALQASGLPAKFLQLEITESMLLDDIDETIELLKIMKNFGVSISIDDFGTGYSSLSYLKKLPIDVIKVDKSFVRDIPEDNNDMAITAAVIAMAHKLQLQVVAEGVETHEQLNFLKNNNCDFIQGFLYSKPLPKERLNEIIEEGVKPS